MTRAASIKHSNWLQFHVGCNAIRARSRLDVIPYGQSNHRTDKLMVSAKHALTMLPRNGLVMTGVIQKCLPKTFARGESTTETPSNYRNKFGNFRSHGRNVPIATIELYGITPGCYLIWGKCERIQISLSVVNDLLSEVETNKRQEKILTAVHVIIC